MSLVSFGMITAASASKDVTVHQSGLQLNLFKVADLDFNDDVQINYLDASQIFHPCYFSSLYW